MMDYWGAMQIGEEARSARQTLGEGEGARAALGQRRKRRSRRALSAEVNTRLALPRTYISMEPRSPNRTLCAH
jgi:hypothetical protein